MPERTTPVLLAAIKNLKTHSDKEIGWLYDHASDTNTIESFQKLYNIARRICNSFSRNR